MSDESDYNSEDDMDYQGPCVDVAELPAVVKNRIRAVKNVTKEVVDLETDYFREVHALDIKYQKMYDELNAKRLKIVNGEHEPGRNEYEWPYEDIVNGVGDMKIEDCNQDENVKGIPKFWLAALKNANDEVFDGMIQPADEPVLEHLTDITVAVSEPENTSFTLSFHFSSNEYFTNEVLTKEYQLKSKPDEKDPLSFDGPEIFKCVGCSVDWKKGKNLTVKTVTKKEKPKGKSKTGAKTVAVKKQVKADTFFNFFSPPEVKEDPEEMSGEDNATLAIDFDIGMAIKEKIVPRAVLWYTGEAIDDEDEFDDVDSDEEEEEEGDN